VDFKKGDIVIYPQHGACKVIDPKKKQDPFGTGKNGQVSSGGGRAMAMNQ